VRLLTGRNVDRFLNALACGFNGGESDGLQFVLLAALHAADCLVQLKKHAARQKENHLPRCGRWPGYDPIWSDQAGFPREMGCIIRIPIMAGISMTLMAATKLELSRQNVMTLTKSRAELLAPRQGTCCATECERIIVQMMS
jgi:hypothetical protein